MEPGKALDLLRKDPNKAFAKCAFKIDNSLVKDNAACRCRAEISKLDGAKHENMFKVTLHTDDKGTDYYYPYVTGLNGIGSCIVPKNAPEGTLVFTGGMNGCSLQVNDVGNNFMFMHCNNGCEGRACGRQIARVDYEHYVGLKGLGLASMAYTLGLDADINGQTSKTDKLIKCLYEYHLVAIKSSSNWAIDGSCILQEVKAKPYIYHRLPGTYLPGVYKLTSFV